MSVASRAVAPFLPDLSVRSGEAEWLDGPDLPESELASVLRELDRFNGVMMGRWPMVRWVARAIRRVPVGERIAVLDVGCGSGDLLRAIGGWARRAGRSVDLIGLDLSPTTVAIARSMTPSDAPIRYVSADVFQFAPDAPVDLIVSSLVAHHLPDERIVEWLRWMDATARRGWLISDLHRNVVPYAFIGLVGKLTNLHPTVIHDGRISVARALTRREWRARIADARVAGVNIRWMLYRWLVSRVKDAP